MPKCIELLSCDWLICNLCYQAIEQVYLIKWLVCAGGLNRGEFVKLEIIRVTTVILNSIFARSRFNWTVEESVCSHCCGLKTLPSPSGILQWNIMCVCLCWIYSLFLHSFFVSQLQSSDCSMMLHFWNCRWLLCVEFDGCTSSVELGRHLMCLCTMFTFKLYIL